MDAPTPEDVRSALARLDGRRQKIVVGMLAVMIKEPQRVRDREWIAERLTEITLLTSEFEADTPDAAVRTVEDYLKANAAELLNASFLLFQRVGLDLASREPAGLTIEAAFRCGLEYLPASGSPGQEKAPSGRDLGEQPIARLMSERGLKPSDLVTASTEQITHKMVARALKGRRLTENTMDKIHRAWNNAVGDDYGRSELFNYEP